MSALYCLRGRSQQSSPAARRQRLHTRLIQQQFVVETTGDCTLVSASNNLRGKLVLSVLGLVAVAHHQLVTPARAAVLEDPVGIRCNGIGTWHFANNQVGALMPPGDLIAVFSCGTETAIAFKVNPNGNQEFVVQTTGDCMLQAAFAFEENGSPMPGKLVLSDFTCAAATPTPTPTPTATPTPTPTP